MSLATVLRQVLKDLTPGDVHVPTADLTRRRRRIADVLRKAKPRGLYVGRALTSECAGQVARWAHAHALPTPDPGLHMTILYSRADVPGWTCAQDTLVVPRTQFLGYQPLGPDAVMVLRFECPEAHLRWAEGLQQGATWDFPDFNPHMTMWSEEYLGGVPLPDFDLVFGPEQATPLDEDIFKLFEEAQHPRGEHGHFVTSAAIQGPLAPKTQRERVWMTHDGRPLPPEAQAHLANISGKGFNAPNYTRQRYFAPDPARRSTYVGEVLDAKGRTKRFYLDENEQAKSGVKTARVRALAEEYPAFSRKLGTQTSQEAMALRLIAKTGMRPGSDRDTGADAKAFGATNMPMSAVRVDGNTLHFKFPAKNGKTYVTSVTDPVLARYAESRAGSARLFETNEGKVRTLFKTLTGHPELQLKDLRTARATSIAQAELAKRTVPTTDREFAALQKAVATKVATALQNTPKVALDKYILDHVWVNHRPGGTLLRRTG